MDSLIYSLNATLPVLLVIVVGYVLKQIGILNDGFVKTANKFNFVVTLLCCCLLTCQQPI